MRNLFIVIAIALALVGCGQEKKPEPIDRLAALAKQAAADAQAQTLTPHEIDMIKFRGLLMGKAGLQLYVVFFGDFGQPIDYFVTDGKCSSSKKRLIRKQKVIQGDRGSYTGGFVVAAPAADGTYGGSDEYIYCKTVDGKYKQWNGDYYASDRPIELTIEPLIMQLGTKVQSQG